MSVGGNIFKLKGKVQHYAWGGYDFIPSLLHIKNEEHTPFAEYWMGAHPSASSELTINNQQVSLTELLNEKPVEVLGDKVFAQFNELPYLFKVLDVHDMLSIQVHPTKEEAIKGFEAEEAAGILINAAHRNYKDKNHKPEIMIALSEFWLLHGFKQKDALEKTLNDFRELTIFLPLFKAEGYEALYSFIMNMPQADIDGLLKPLVKKEYRRKLNNELTKQDPGWWVAKLFEEKQDFTNLDRGIFSIYFFNIVKVDKGGAVFQAAGIPHAYLEGQNVELMANSDNVLRGGLTPKHIDVIELMKHTTFQGITPVVMKGRNQGQETFFDCPVPDFSISEIKLKAGETYTGTSTSFEILLVVEGGVLIENTTPVKQGESLAVIANSTYNFMATGNCVIYKAYVP